MLPNLDQLSLVPTAGNLANAKWDEDEACSICLFPLGQPSPDERYAWPFSGDGTGFTAVACLQGHTFHKGCLRFMQRFNDTRCPDCRTPMFAEVVKDVSRPDAEQLEREQRQAEEREQARAQREREDREREQQRRNPSAAERSQDPNDHFVMWTFAVKGFIMHALVDDMRNHFDNFMGRRWTGPNRVSAWNSRLVMELQWEDLSPDTPDSGDALQPITHIRCKVFLPARLETPFRIWFQGVVEELGYARAMHRILGISTAKQVGESMIADMGLNNDIYYPMHQMAEQNQDLIGMSDAEYEEWAAWEFLPEDWSLFGPPTPIAGPGDAPARAPASPRAPTSVEYEDSQSATDFAVQWTFFVKGYIPTRARIWFAVRYFFEEYMHREWPTTFEPVEMWGRGLGIFLRHGDVAPLSATHASMRIEFTRCRFRMHLPEAKARQFAEWLTTKIHTQSYGQAMHEILGITEARKAGLQNGTEVALMAGMNEENSEATENVLRMHETSLPAMTWQQYQAWPLFAYDASFAAPQPAEAPQQQADWMYEEAMEEMRADDPITQFRPAGWAATDVTIRWRFWLKGPMSAVDMSNTPVHWRRSFADLMSNAEGLPRMRTSWNPWFDRLWVWIHAEEPRIRGPRTGRPLVNGDIVQRCEFALKLPADVASAWLTVVAQGFGGISYWHNLVPTWFYVDHAWSTVSRDRPSLDSSTLFPLVGAPMMTEAEYNAWEPWRNIQRFRTIGEDRY